MELLPADIIGEIFGQLKWKNWALALALTCKKCLWTFQNTAIKYVHFSYENIDKAKIYIYYGNLILFQVSAVEMFLDIKNFDMVVEMVSKSFNELAFPYNSHNKEEMEQSMKLSVSYFISFSGLLRTNELKTIKISIQSIDQSLVWFKEIVMLIKNTPIFDYFGKQIQTVDERINIQKIHGLQIHKRGKNKGEVHVR